jgi:hypothetical protein
MPGDGHFLYAVPPPGTRFRAVSAEPGLCSLQTGFGTLNRPKNRLELCKAAWGELGADAVECGLEILGVGTGEVDLGATAGMLEAESDRMQPLTI